MAADHLPEFRRLLATPRLGERATGVEVAAGRRIERRGDLAFDALELTVTLVETGDFAQ